MYIRSVSDNVPADASIYKTSNIASTEDGLDIAHSRSLKTYTADDGQKLDGRVHPFKIKFQYLQHLEDQLDKSRSSMLTVLDDLHLWSGAEIHGVKLASIPNAQWISRTERLGQDATHLLSLLDDLTERQKQLYLMVSYFFILVMLGNFSSYVKSIVYRD